MTLPADSTERLTGYSVDWRVLVVSATAAIAAAVLSGLGPALAVSRRDLNVHLKEGHGALGRGRRRFSRVLVGAEVTLTAVLLIVPEVLILEWWSSRGASRTGPAKEILMMTVEPWRPADREPEQLKIFYRRLLETVRRAPGVRSAALTSGTPFQASRTHVTIEGTGNDTRVRVAADCLIVSPGYLETTSIALLAGRFFIPQDDASSEKVVILNEATSRQHWGARSPVGDGIMLWGVRRTIVGVVADTVRRPTGRPAYSEVMVPYLQADGRPLRVTVRVLGDPHRLKGTIAKSIQTMDPDQPILEVKTLDQQLAGNNAEILRLLGLFGAFAVGALLLSGVGIHGLVSYSVSERVREIGIRRALGGTKGRVMWQVLRDGMLTAGVGLLLGFWAGVLGSAALLLHGGTPAGLAWHWAFRAGGGTIMLALVVCLWACYGPARRAAAAEPMAVLRCE
jgi:putative ABC transport system permease protein